MENQSLAAEFFSMVFYVGFFAVLLTAGHYSQEIADKARQVKTRLFGVTR